MSDLSDMTEKDWELEEDYYGQSSSGPELRLEDFMDEEGGEFPAALDGKEKGPGDERLEKTIHDVHQVLEMAQEGKTIGEIAAALGLDFQYVYDIQVTAQGFREDDEIAVAHMMCM